jgi:hypothetical protein
VSPGGSQTKLYRSEAVKDNLNPNWQPYEVNLSDFDGLDKDILIECFDWYASCFFIDELPIN